MLQKGLIRLITSPFSYLILLVKKQDRTQTFCMDYHALNVIMIKDHFPIPTIDELLDELGGEGGRGASWFYKLDLLQGCHQIQMHKDDVYKNVFHTHHGHYEFKVMPIDLCNALSSFQVTMNVIFRPYLHHFIIIFFDDILIYNRTLEDHLIHLEKAFEVLLNGQFILKFLKCFFA